MKLKSLPIGIQTFELMITGQHLYVDKTALIYELVKPANPKYFLSRPRGFGKSSLLSTLEAFFLGKKELFRGLAIEKLEKKWEEYPVIHLDISEVGHHDEEMLKQGLIRCLVNAARHYEITLDTDQIPHEVFNDLITLIAEKTNKKVVVLIDEYDNPIVNKLKDPILVQKYFEILLDFYRVTKSLDRYLKFVFITGVSNFAKGNLFSGLNHLNNITMNSVYSALCGYTQNELQHYFSDYIANLSEKLEKSQDELLMEIKEWYNGYQFVENTPKIYNPFSVLQLFNNGFFKNFWYQTGTFSFLVNAIRNSSDLQPEQFENYKVLLPNFDTLVIEKPTILPLLFQTGYLTIKNFNEESRVYELGYPNQEVRESFLQSLLVYCNDNDLSTAS